MKNHGPDPSNGEWHEVSGYTFFKDRNGVWKADTQNVYNGGLGLLRNKIPPAEEAVFEAQKDVVESHYYYKKNQEAKWAKIHIQATAPIHQGAAKAYVDGMSKEDVVSYVEKVKKDFASLL